MGILLPLLTALIPLLITPGLLFHYDITPKIAVLVLAAALALARPRIFAGELGSLLARPVGRWFCGIALFQVVWFAVVTGVSARPWFSVFGSGWRRLGLLTTIALVVFVVLAAAHLTGNPARTGPVLRAFAVAAIVASLYGIAQYFDLDPLQNAAAYHAEAGDSVIVRPPGTLGQADYFGWWLAIALFCALALARIEKGLWRQVGYIAAGLSAVAIVFTGTRSAMLAVAAGLVPLLAASGLTIRRRHAGVLAICAVAFIGFYVSPAGTRLRARVRWSVDEPLGGARPLLWRDSVRMVAAKPLAGLGPETYSTEFAAYQSVELARLFPAFYNESPHNSALDLLTSGGIPALIAALAWVALGFYAAFSMKGALRAPLAGALLASTVASLFGSLTLGPLFATAIVIAILVAILIESHGTKPASPVSIRPAIALAAAIPVGLVLAAYGLFLLIADFNLRQFERAPDSTAVSAYRLAAATALPGAGDDLYAARRLSAICPAIPDPATRATCTQTTAGAASRATATADNTPNAWYNLAIVAASANDARGVESSLRTAIAQAPNWFKPHWSLANLLALTGRLDEARVEAQRAALLDGGKDPEVAQTLAKLTQ
jgi:O-antigen ligase